LAISQNIAEFMGSSIYVRSEIGKGSVFGLEVDLAAADEDFAGRWSSHQNTQRKIIGVKGKTYKLLLVDDKWENRTVLVNLLEEIGFDIIEASQGQEALELAKSEHPDLIITDLVMPVMDGFEMMRHLRRSPDLCNIIIIVTSASAFSKDATQSLETGGNDFISKPVSFDLLLAKIEKHLNLEWIYEDITTIPSNNHGLANFARSPDPSIRSLSVVVPDDEDINILFDLAMQGNINGILEYAIAIEQKDDQLVPFAKELQNLANEFKIKQIKELVKSLRNKPS
jgi:CheY-like chemotaxis protein